MISQKKKIARILCSAIVICAIIQEAFNITLKFTFKIKSFKIFFNAASCSYACLCCVAAFARWLINKEILLFSRLAGICLLCGQGLGRVLQEYFIVASIFCSFDLWNTVNIIIIRIKWVLRYFMDETYIKVIVGSIVLTH